MQLTALWWMELDRIVKEHELPSFKKCFMKVSINLKQDEEQKK